MKQENSPDRPRLVSANPSADQVRQEIDTDADNAGNIVGANLVSIRGDVRVFGNAAQRLADLGEVDLAARLLTATTGNEKIYRAVEEAAEEQGVSGGYRLSIESADQAIDLATQPNTGEVSASDTGIRGDVRVFGNAAQRLADLGEVDLAARLLTATTGNEKIYRAVEEAAEEQGVSGGYRLSIESADQAIDLATRA